MSVLASRREAAPPSDASAGGPERLNPFPGPRAFQIDEEKLFFGRGFEVGDLVSLLHAQRLVLVHAPSGAGKSSLVQAGVIPMAREQGFEVLPVARLRCESTGTHRLPASDENRFVFNILENWRTQHNFARDAKGSTLAEALDLPIKLDGKDGVPSTVVVIDQFEELFVLHPDRWRDRQDFFAQLQKALDAHPTLRILLLIRDDYLAHLEPLAATLRDRLRMRYHLKLLDARQALDAIVQPVEAAGRTFAPGAAETIVRELLRSPAEGAEGLAYEAEHVDAVQLQIVLRTLWDSVPTEAGEITTSHVSEFGDVDRALVNFYEQAVAAAVASVRRLSERKVRLWFENELITPARSRGLVYQGADATEGLPNQAVAVLEQRRVIRSEPRGAALWFELTHDRLVSAVLDSNRGWFATSSGNRRRYVPLLVASMVATFVGASLVFGGDSVSEQARFVQEKEGSIPAGASTVEPLKFEGRLGQLASVRLTTSEGLIARVELEGPDQRILSKSADVLNDESALLNERLPVDGTYKARIVAFDDSVGDYHLQIMVQEIDADVALVDPSVRSSIGRPGEVDIYRFDGRAGDVVLSEMRAAGKDIDSFVMLSGPSGLVAANDDIDEEDFDSRLVATLPEDGDYEVRVTTVEADVGGNYVLTVRTVDAPELKLGATTGQLAVGSAAVFSVRRSGGGPFTVRVDPGRGLDTKVSVADREGEAGAPLDAGAEGQPDRSIAIALANKTYLLVIAPASPDRGGSFTVSLGFPDLVPLAGAPPQRTADGAVEPSEVGDFYRFRGTAGDFVTVAGSSDDAIGVILMDADGHLVDAFPIEDNEEAVSIELPANDAYSVFIATARLDKAVPYRLAVESATPAATAE